MRIHGAYVTEQEIARLTSYLRKTGRARPTTTPWASPRSPTEAAEVDGPRRAVRRGRALRGPERPGLDQHAAAALPHRLLARRPARRHDGARRHHRAGRRLEAARDPGGGGLLRDGGHLAASEPNPPAAREPGGSSGVALVRPGAAALPAARKAPKPRPGRRRPPPAPTPRSTRKPRRPRRACAPPRRAWRNGSEWETVVLRYRRVVARYPQSGLLATTRCSRCGDLYREMADALPRPALRRRRAHGLPHARGRVPEQQPGRGGALSRARDRPREPGAAQRWPRRRAPTSRPIPTRSARRDAPRALLRERAAREARCPARRRPAWPRSSTCASGAARPRRAWSSTSSAGADPVTTAPTRPGPAVGRPRRHAAPPEPHEAHASRWATACSSRCASRRTATTWCAWCSTSRRSRSTRSSTSKNPTRLVIDVRGRGAPRSRIAAGARARRGSGSGARPRRGRRAAPRPRGPSRACCRPTARPLPRRRSPSRASTRCRRGPRTRAARRPDAAAPRRRRLGPPADARGAASRQPRRLLQPGPPARAGRAPHRDRRRPRRPRPRHHRRAAACRRRTSCSTWRCASRSWCAQELGAEVILTRSSDVFIPLEERTAIANSQGRGPLPLDPRQRQPQPERARHRDLLPELRAHDPTPRRWPRARTPSPPRPSRTCRTW